MLVAAALLLLWVGLNATVDIWFKRPCEFSLRVNAHEFSVIVIRADRTHVWVVATPHITVASTLWIVSMALGLFAFAPTWLDHRLRKWFISLVD